MGKTLAEFIDWFIDLLTTNKLTEIGFEAILKQIEDFFFNTLLGALGKAEF